MKPVAMHWTRALGLLRRPSGPVVIALFVVTLAGFVWSAYRLHTMRQQNADIVALAEGRDVEVSLDAPSELLFARAQFLLVRGHFDEMHPLLDAVTRRGDDTIRAQLFYNTANARLRAAYDHIERQQISEAVPQVNLAKDSLREALRLIPADWNFKHNLDVAMQLVRDLPKAGPASDEEEPEMPEELWTDLPGTPGGLP